eukprot:scaffold61146_cov40-Prasinocladus_malaysianus.AAC.2
MDRIASVLSVKSSSVMCQKCPCVRTTGQVVLAIPWLVVILCVASAGWSDNDRRVFVTVDSSA